MYTAIVTVAALALLQDIGELDMLVTQLKSRDDEIEKQAHDRLVRIGAKAVPTLRKSLRQQDDRLRSSVAYILRDIGPDAHEASPELAEMLRTDDAAAAGQALEAIGEPAVGPIVKLLERDENWSNAGYAISVLSRIGPDAKQAIPVVVRRLRSLKEIEDRLTLAVDLVAIDAGNAEGAKELIRALTDKDERTQLTAACALARNKDKGALAIPILLKFLKGGNYEDRLSCYHALWELGPQAKSLLPKLRNWLVDWQHEPIGQIVAATLLLKFDTDEIVLAKARQALAKQLAVLKNHVNYPTKTTARLAIDSLTLLGPRAKEAEQELKQALRSPDSRIRQGAKAALARIQEVNK